MIRDGKSNKNTQDFLYRASVEMICPKCGSRMGIDDSDSDEVYINLHRVYKKITNWWACPYCDTSCIVEKKYTYVDADGNELKGEDE